MVSGSRSASGTYKPRSMTVCKLPPHHMNAKLLIARKNKKAKRVAELRRRASVDNKTDDFTEEERKWKLDTKEDYARQCFILATQALENFNQTSGAKQGVQYELVEAVTSSAFLQPLLGFHVNFKAKPKGAPDNQKRLFFAEIISNKVIRCCILRNGDPNSVGRCPRCHTGFILHPLVDGSCADDGLIP